MKQDRVFIDTEFIDDGKTIELISIGACFDMTSGEIATFHACNLDADLNNAGCWVKKNVIPKLPPATDSAWMPRKTIASRFQYFCGETPEFWGYFSAYDWVVVCQLYGRMVDVPNGWPMYCNDIRQWANALRIKELPAMESGQHNAVQDALWNRTTWLWLKEQECNAKNNRQ